MTSKSNFLHRIKMHNGRNISHQTETKNPHLQDNCQLINFNITVRNRSANVPVLLYLLPLNLFVHQATTETQSGEWGEWQEV